MSGCQGTGVKDANKLSSGACILDGGLKGEVLEKIGTIYAMLVLGALEERKVKPEMKVYIDEGLKHCGPGRFLKMVGWS